MSSNSSEPNRGGEPRAAEERSAPAERLVADREEIARFADALFRYASSGTFVSLRSFYHDPRRPPADIRSVKLRLDDEGLASLIRLACARATFVANLVSSAVFAPPICTFKNKKSAAEGNLAEGLTLSVECDIDPLQARSRIEGLLGQATVVVASGGQWTDLASGELQEKLHLHWRLSEPTREPAEHLRLKRARRLAAALTESDASAVPLVHPLRWPGSWHRKFEPRLARIIALSPEREIHLEDTLELLDDTARLAGLSGDQEKASPGGEREPAAAEDLHALATAIPNPDLTWDEWNLVGMAFWAASGGGEAGLSAFLHWSAMSSKDNPANTHARWEHFRGSPPNRLSVGTLVHRARIAVSGFRLPSWKQRPEQEADIAALVAGRTAEPDAGSSAFDYDNTRSADDRQLLKLGPGWINDTTRRCARLLDDDLYLRGSVPAILVRVEDLPSGHEAQDREAEPGVVVGGVRHARGSLIFAEPSPERIMYRLDERVLFQRYDKRLDDWVSASCPVPIARRVVGAAAELGFRPCAGIVSVPLFLSGEILVTSGYHTDRGVFLDLPAGMTPTASTPTRSDAGHALDFLLRSFRGYIDGRGPEDALRLRSGFAAAALTAVLRPSLPAAPAILLDANVPGAGKGKAARALAVIATGRLPAIVTEGHAEEETEKRLASAILSGAPAILLDNLQRTLASSTLESGLTEGLATIRLFGRLIDVTVPCAALVLITANNAALRADMLRRTLPVRIIADTDQPELRRFAFEPYEEARRLRADIVAAALTVARAWWLARDTHDGQRIRQTTLGSFEHWAELVAGAVEWLTGFNPVALIEERKAEDPMRGAERRVMAALHELFGEAEWTAKEAIGRAADMGTPATGLDPDTWAAVLSFKGDRPTAHQVGLWLRKRKDKVLGDIQLVGSLDRNGIARWQVRGMRGIAGDRPNQPREFSKNGIGSAGHGNNGHVWDKSEDAGEDIPRSPPHPPQAEEFEL